MRYGVGSRKSGATPGLSFETLRTDQVSHAPRGLPAGSCRGKLAVNWTAKERVLMTGRVCPEPQPVLGPLTAAPVVLVVSVKAGGAAAVRRLPPELAAP